MSIMQLRGRREVRGFGAPSLARPEWRGSEFASGAAAANAEVAFGTELG
jgi:hypothetical protein